jgi:hypothetical protein
MPKDDREELIVPESAGADPLQFFTRPIVRRNDLHRASPLLLYFAAVRRLLLAGLLLLAATGCSQPPQKEIDQAQAALDLARTGGAERYAADDYAAAAAALLKARASVDERDYRQALSYAIDARQRAQSSFRQAGEGKAKALRTADALLADTVALAGRLDTRLAAAAAARVPAKELRGPRAARDEARNALQEARTQIGAGNYEKAGELLASVRKKLEATIAATEKIRLPPPRTAKSRPRS